MREEHSIRFAVNGLDCIDISLVPEEMDSEAAKTTRHFIGMLLIHLMTSYEQKRPHPTNVSNASIAFPNFFNMCQYKQLEWTITKEKTIFQIGNFILTETVKGFQLQIRENVEIAASNIIHDIYLSQAPLTSFVRLHADSQAILDHGDTNIDTISGVAWVFVCPVDGVVEKFKETFVPPKAPHDDDFEISPLARIVVKNLYPPQLQQHVEPRLALMHRQVTREGKYKSKINNMIKNRQDVLTTAIQDIEKRYNAYHQSFWLKTMVGWFMLPMLNAQLQLKQTKLTAVNLLKAQLEKTTYNAEEAIEDVIRTQGTVIFKRRLLPLPSTLWNRSNTALLFRKMQKEARNNTREIQAIETGLTALTSVLTRT